jgi:hypothetical protein
MAIFRSMGSIVVRAQNLASDLCLENVAYESLPFMRDANLSMSLGCKVAEGADKLDAITSAAKAFTELKVFTAALEVRENWFVVGMRPVPLFDLSSFPGSSALQCPPADEQPGEIVS